MASIEAYFVIDEFVHFDVIRDRVVASPFFDAVHRES